MRRWPLIVGGGVLLVGSLAVFYSLLEPAGRTSVPDDLPVRSAAAVPSNPALGKDAASVLDPTPVVPTVADLSLHCPELLGQPEGGYPSADFVAEDCRRTLDARFALAHTAQALVPLDQPMAWSDVFRNVAERFETVVAALADPECQVADDDLRPHLAERCAARAMAETAMFNEICGRIADGFGPLRGYNFGLDHIEYLPALGKEDRERAIGELDAGRRYTSNRDQRIPHHVVDELDARLVDQREYWHQRERIDEDYFRTAWLRSRCEAERPSVGAMLPRAAELRELIDHAAGLGDEFALAHSPQSRGRALKLRESNLLLAWVNLAESYAGDVHDAWQAAERRAREGLAARPPYFANRVRRLEMAGIECPSACSPEQLRETERRFGGVLNAFVTEARRACDSRGDCQRSETLDALREPLQRAMDSEVFRRESARRQADYGKRAEALRLRYTFAVEELAARTGVPVRVDILRRVLADPEVPWYLDHTEMEFVRTEARELVAEALARGG